MKQQTRQARLKPIQQSQTRRSADDQVAREFVEFAAGVLHLASSLPHNVIGMYVAKRLIRAGSHSGEKFEEVKVTANRDELSDHVASAAKSLRETMYWLRLIDKADLCAQTQVEKLVHEAESILKALRNRRGKCRSSKLSRKGSHLAVRRR